MSLTKLIEHSVYRETLFTTRIIGHEALKAKLLGFRAKNVFQIDIAGYSAQKREIYKVTLGRGKTTVLLWSQMHGDEPTGTLAFLDLFNFFAANDEHNNLRQEILANCTLHFVPMLNPDGEKMYQRRNAQGIDINRDFLQQQSPEAQLLVLLQKEIQPQFGFNMHDQESLWSVAGTQMPASISLLAPPADAAATITPGRLKTMQVISSVYEMFREQIPGQIGRWSEEFEPRAFGDNFQQLGTATLLIEAGGHKADSERQYVRKLNFEIVLHALHQIATGEYASQTTAPYYSIPTNSKELFHILIKNCRVSAPGGEVKVDIGLNYTEAFEINTQSFTKYYTVADIGDLSVWNAYDIFDAEGALINGTITLDQQAHFSITFKSGETLTFKQGSFIAG